jgi:cytochrome oxidase Cu insertion factor (SCO1/SenC/PrrC family)
MPVWYLAAMRPVLALLGLMLWAMTWPPRMLAAGPTLLASFQSASSQSSGATATVDLETIGPKVGEPLPDFTLPDQHGQPRSLKSLMGANGAVVVFFRSADR